MYHDQFNDPGKGKEKGLIISQLHTDGKRNACSHSQIYPYMLCYKDHNANKSAYITELWDAV